MNAKFLSTQEIVRQLTKTRILLGCFGGLVLALVAWGLDANAIRLAHGILPWVKLAVGALIAIPLYGAASYLAGRFGTKYYIALISFTVSGYIIAWMATHLSYDWYEALLKLFNAGFSMPIHYEYDITAQTRFVMTAAILIVLSAVFAFFYDGLVNQVYSSLTAMSAVTAIIVIGLFFGAGGFIVDHFNNSSFRTPIIKTDYYIGRARLIQSAVLPSDPKQIGWERTFLNLGINLDVPYRMFTSSLEPAWDTAHVMVLFREDWYDCIVVDGQPFVCEPVQD